MNELSRKNGKGKIEQYLKSRLWNLKLRGAGWKKGAGWKIPTKKLLAEIEMYYLGGKKLKDDPEMILKLTKMISTARNRTDSKWSTLRKNALEWARILNTSMVIIFILFRDGIITSSYDIKKIRRILELVGHIPDND